MNYIRLFPKDHCFTTVCNSSSPSFSPSAQCWLDYILESRISPAGDSLDFAGLLIQHKEDFIAADQTWFSCIPIRLCVCMCAFRGVKVWPSYPLLVGTIITQSSSTNSIFFPLKANPKNPQIINYFILCMYYYFLKRFFLMLLLVSEGFKKIQK